MNWWVVEITSHVPVRDGLGEITKNHLSSSSMNRDVTAIQASPSLSLAPVSELDGKHILSVNMFSRAMVFAISSIAAFK